VCVLLGNSASSLRTPQTDGLVSLRSSPNREFKPATPTWVRNTMSSEPSRRCTSAFSMSHVVGCVSSACASHVSPLQSPPQRRQRCHGRRDVPDVLYGCPLVYKSG